MVLVDTEIVLALVALIGLIIGYFISHFLGLREKSILREFEMRKEGKKFFLPLYGHLANLADLVVGYIDACENGETQIIMKNGFVHLKPDEVITQYKQSYAKFTRFLGESRTSGYEVFFPKEISRLMETILGYSARFYEEETWDFENAQSFTLAVEIAMEIIEEILSLKRKTWKQKLLESRTFTYLGGLKNWVKTKLKKQEELSEEA